MSKQKPILFSTPMVQAIIAGRKTVTRRIIKPQPTKQWAVEKFCKEGPGSVDSSDLTAADTEIDDLIENSPLKPGDILYIREEYYQIGHWEPDNDRKKKRKTGRQPWKFVPDSSEIRYCDNPPPTFRKGRHKESPEVSAWHKRLGRFMHKSAARIWLEVLSVRPERLQDITEEDAVREGIEPHEDGWKLYTVKHGNTWVKKHVPVLSFKSLWESINGAGSWEANPWVWRYGFKVLSTTGRPDNI